MSAVSGIYRDGKNRLISKKEAIEHLGNIGECFYKPSEGSGSGRGCRLCNFVDGFNIVTEVPVSDELIDFGSNFVIQERINCHKSIKAFSANSVNTFRVITYLWKECIYHLPIILRFGIGDSEIDNAHAGGMFIAIDDDGDVHEKAFTEFNNYADIHPTTHIIFKEQKIPLIRGVITAAERLHACVPQIGTVNWDFTINSEGNPILIEANTEAGSIWLAQMSHGRGVFGEQTSEILRWLRKMKSLPLSRRSEIGYGEM